MGSWKEGNPWATHSVIITSLRFYLSSTHFTIPNQQQKLNIFHFDFHHHLSISKVFLKQLCNGLP